MDEPTLSEVSGLAKKHPVGVNPEENIPFSSSLSSDDPELVHFLVRWESRPKDGDKYKWFPVFARDYLEAARFFSMSCDMGNPRPPISRTAIVRLVHTADPEDERVIIETRPTITYTARYC